MHKFIAIGDIVTDAFIRLKEASVTKDPKGHEMLSMVFGDKLPYESVEVVQAVGNSSNAAVSAARLGLRSALVANIGDDQEGKDCLANLSKENVATDFIKSHLGQKTNYHYVLWYEHDRTILVKHEKYSYSLPEIGEPEWLYLSSLGEDTKEFHHEITGYLQNHPNIKLAFQPGTFQMKLGKDELKEIYAKSEVFFCNVEEAERILGIETLGIQELGKRMRELGPKIAIITDGASGAYAFTETDSWFISPYPDPKPPFERTGAGDAFASTTIVALAKGKDLPTALAWGAVNSMSVVQEVGAQKGLLTENQIEDYLKALPDFAAKKI